MGAACSGRAAPSALSCLEVLPPGSDRPTPWVARLVARTAAADGTTTDQVLAATATLLGHAYMARATFLRPLPHTVAIDPEWIEPNYDLATPSRAMEAEMASLDFDPLAIYGLLRDAADAGATIHLQVAGSPIGAKPPRPRRTPPPQPGWIPQATWSRTRPRTTNLTPWAPRHTRPASASSRHPAETGREGCGRREGPSIAVGSGRHRRRGGGWDGCRPNAMRSRSAGRRRRWRGRPRIPREERDMFDGIGFIDQGDAATEAPRACATLATDYCPDAARLRALLEAGRHVVVRTVATPCPNTGRPLVVVHHIARTADGQELAFHDPAEAELVARLLRTAAGDATTPIAHHLVRPARTQAHAQA